MTFIGMSTSTKNYLFMRSNNSTRIVTHALFDERLFPRCPETSLDKGKRKNTRLPPPADDPTSVPYGIDNDDDFPSRSPHTSQKGQGKDHDDDSVKSEPERPSSPEVPSPPALAMDPPPALPEFDPTRPQEMLNTFSALNLQALEDAIIKIGSNSRKYLKLSKEYR